MSIGLTYALGACGGGHPSVASAPGPTGLPSAAASAPTAVASGPRWSYEGATGPTAWATLDPAFASCGRHETQSPVDLVPPATGAAAPPTLAFTYAALPLRVANNGHLVLADTAGRGARLLVDGRPYDLVQFHAHAPSEHTLRGAPSDLEVHFVHRDASGALAVVALLARRGAPNAPLAAFFANLPSAPSSAPPAVPGANVDLAAVIGERRQYYAYEGSLTAPPCTEGVRWFVLDEPTEVSPEQLAAVRTAQRGDTARPTQPLGARRLTHTR